MDHEATTDSTNTTSTAPAGEATRATEAPSAALHELSKADRDSFYATGKIPDQKAKPDAAADPSTAPAEDDTAAEIAAKDSAPASEPGTPAKDKKDGKPDRRSADNRVQELLTDRNRERERAERADRRADDLERRLRELETKQSKPDAKTDSSTAADPSEPEWKKFRAMKDAPKADDFETLDDYVAAMGTFIAGKIARQEATGVVTERETQHAEYAAAEREMEAIVTESVTRLQAEEKAFPQLIAKVDPRFKKIVPARMLPDGQTVGRHHFAKDQITFESEHPLQLSAFYSSEEGLAEWKALLQMSPKQIQRTILARDLSFKAPSSQGESQPAAKATKTFTKTPPPPENTGKKPASVGDPAEKAVKAGDFREFMRAMDEAEGTTSRYSR